MRESKRKSPVAGRQVPRFHLDVDWFVESKGSSSLGRGLELSVHGALLPVSCLSPFSGEVTLYLSFAARPRMFKARCEPRVFDGRGWFLRFLEVSPEDHQLLGHTLITEFGVAALPNLEHRMPQTVGA